MSKPVNIRSTHWNPVFRIANTKKRVPTTKPLTMDDALGKIADLKQSFALAKNDQSASVILSKISTLSFRMGMRTQRQIDSLLELFLLAKTTKTKERIGKMIKAAHDAQVAGQENKRKLQAFLSLPETKRKRLTEELWAKKTMQKLTENFQYFSRGIFREFANQSPRGWRYVTLIFFQEIIEKGERLAATPKEFEVVEKTWRLLADTVQYGQWRGQLQKAKMQAEYLNRAMQAAQKTGKPHLVKQVSGLLTKIKPLG